MIGIVDYGGGNLQSVENALIHLGAEYHVVRDAAGLDETDRILFPGVGHFGQMMVALERNGLGTILRHRIAEGTPYFGICLGLQALFESSAEAPEVAGFGVFEGKIERFDRSGLRVPHMGWDSVKLVRPSRLLPEAESDPYFYFAHSFHVPICAGATAVCDYGAPFVAALERENVWGVQFHPEKSGPLGLALLRRFIEL